MRVLICNNFVRHGSGIDAMVRIEETCLARAGHDVQVFSRDNNAFDAASLPRKLRMLAGTLYSSAVARELDKRLTARTFDIVHVHNTVPLLTGAVYDAVRNHPDVTRVQSLHNYRAECLYSYCYRSGKRCHLCRRWGPFGCVLFRCYGRSLIRSSALAAARGIDRLHGRRTGMDADHYLAVSNYVRQKHIELGIHGQSISVLQNACDDLGLRTVAPRNKLVYVGAVIDAKGVRYLPSLARLLPEFAFHVIGEGERLPWIRAQQAATPNLTIHGYCNREQKRALWQDALFTLAPSLWEEPFGLTAVESFSLGVPVITTGAGGLSEVVSHRQDGLVMLFDAIENIATAVRHYAGDQTAYRTMSQQARSSFERSYTLEKYASHLQTALQSCLENKKKR